MSERGRGRTGGKGKQTGKGSNTNRSEQAKPTKKTVSHYLYNLRSA
jgi:hypothetical protein